MKITCFRSGLNHKNMKYLGAFIAFVIFSSSVVYGQSTTDQPSDSTLSDAPLISINERTIQEAELIETYAKRYNPRKAGLYSAVLPGLGQAYNKKYWKMPIIYGGFIGFGFGINFYQVRRKKFRAELFSILESGAGTSESGFNEAQLRTIVDKARRERDYLMVLTGILYMLNIVDAHIDSHLKEFDLNEKLKLSLDPMIHQQGQLQAGLSISLNFQ